MKWLKHLNTVVYSAQMNWICRLGRYLMIQALICALVCPPGAYLNISWHVCGFQSQLLHMCEFRLYLASLSLKSRVISEKSLLRRLQEQTLPDEAPPEGKIYQFSKIAVTFEQI